MTLYIPAILRTVRLGVKSLILHGGRSILTMLGIIFGVSSVIAMLAVGEGVSHQQQSAIRKLGSTNILLEAIKPEASKKFGTSQSMTIQYGLTYLDAWRIQTTIPHVKHILPVREARKEAQYKRIREQIQVIGTLPSYYNLEGMHLLNGRFLTAADQKRKDNVCVVSQNLAGKMFGVDGALGNVLKIDTFYYKVVGVVASSLEENKKAGSFGNWDLAAYIPMSTSRALIGETVTTRETGSFSSEKIELHRIIVQCNDTEHVEETAHAVQRLLTRFHDQKDYQMTVPLRLLLQMRQTKRIFTIVLGSIAAISLVVGGIGIMNIMLATVTERTREIGIRRAMGARKSDIITQFLVETLVLSLGGGAIGVLLGMLIPHQISEMTEIPTMITLWSLGAAFGVSAAVGLVFGVYPAVRAANLDPIEALRHE